MGAVTHPTELYCPGSYGLATSPEYLRRAGWRPVCPSCERKDVGIYETTLLVKDTPPIPVTRFMAHYPSPPRPLVVA